MLIVEPIGYILTENCENHDSTNLNFLLKFRFSGFQIFNIFRL